MRGVRRGHEVPVVLICALAITEHGLGDGRGADPDTGVVTTERFHHRGLALLVDGAARDANTGGGFDGDIDDDSLPAGDTAQDAAGIVGEKSIRRHFIAVFCALLLNAGEAGTEFHRLYRIDAHHGMRNISIQLIKNGFTQTNRYTFGNHG